MNMERQLGFYFDESKKQARERRMNKKMAAREEAEREKGKKGRVCPKEDETRQA